MIDDETRAELEQTANAMTAQASAAMEREARNPHLNRDGLCMVESIKLDVFAPAIAEVRTSLSETLPVFSRDVVDHLLIAQQQKRQVRLFLRRSDTGTRYIQYAWMAPMGTEATYECAGCGDTMTRREDGVYRCGNCHWICQVKTAANAKK